MENNKGHVFLDEAHRPYLLRKWGDKDKLWLFYWHPDGYWTSLREVKSSDRFPHNLTQSEQDIYHTQHEKWDQRFSCKKAIEGKGE